MQFAMTEMDELLGFEEIVAKITERGRLRVSWPVYKRSEKTMISDDDKKAIATTVVEEMEARRRKRMEETPPPPAPKKERRLCLFTVMDHGVGFPDRESRAVLEKCFYAWATFRPDSWTPRMPDEAVIVALGDGRKLPTPLHAVLLAGVVSCVQIDRQDAFGDDPLVEDFHSGRFASADV